MCILIRIVRLEICLNALFWLPIICVKEWWVLRLISTFNIGIDSNFSSHSCCFSFVGPVLSILKPGLDFCFTKPSTPRPTWLVPTPSSVQTFKKQPYFKQTGEHSEPLVMQTKVMDPVSLRNNLSLLCRERGSLLYIYIITVCLFIA